MDNPYRFSRFPANEQSLTLEDCKKSGCGSGCGINPIRLYRRELSERMKSRGMTLEEDQLLPPRKFDEKGDLNPFEIVAQIYDNTFRSGLEWCLDKKENIHDCVFGCYSRIVDPTIPMVHSHQRRVYYMYPCALPHMSKIISDEIEKKSYNNFEEIVSELYKLKAREAKISKNHNRKIDSSNGYGALCVFDTALRLAWHASESDEGIRKALMPRNVWLQQGAWEGASCLLQLGQLSKPPYIHPDFKSEKRKISDPEDFPKPISDMEPYHIENLLCIFHPLFEKWVEADKIAN